MTQYSNPNLQPNPFVTYRDPQTGLWVVVQSTDVAQDSNHTANSLEQTIQSKNQKS